MENGTTASNLRGDGDSPIAWEERLAQLHKQYGPAWIVRTLETRIRQLAQQKRPEAKQRALEVAKERRHRNKGQFALMKEELARLKALHGEGK